MSGIITNPAKPCHECFRRERKAAGLCVDCDRPGKLKADGSRYVHCKKHYRPVKRKPKYPGLAAAREQGRMTGRKHSLSAADLRTAKLLLAADRPIINEIAKQLHTSPRTIRRVAAGEYDWYFKDQQSGVR